MCCDCDSFMEREPGESGFDPTTFRSETPVPTSDVQRESEPPREPGQAPEEIDRQRAHEMRGENLTEQEFAERAKVIAELRHAIDAWTDEHVKNVEGATFGDRRILKELTEFLSREHAEKIAKITGNFLDHRMYPNRPVVKLRLREVGEMPDVLIFGWRGGDPHENETKIHDHADSSVSLTIHQGEVQETVYRIEPDEWKDREVGQSMKYLGEKTKRYPAGMGKTYRSPYLHTVGGTPENDLSVTIHGYWRPTKQVAYDFEVQGDKFVEIGIS